MPNMKKSDPMLAKQVKKDVKFLKEKAAAKTTTKKAAVKPTAKPKVTAKPKPMETTRVGGIISIPKKPKKIVY